MPSALSAAARAPAKPASHRRASAGVRLFLALCPLLAAACEGCSDAPPPAWDAGEAVADDGGNTAVACETHRECGSERHCAAGLCRPGAPDAGLPPTSLRDAGPGPDASEPVAALVVIPGNELEFGAQQLGVPVVRDLVLQNAGNAPMTVFVLSLDDDSEEFSVQPSGTISERLEPSDTLSVTISHTPADGIPDVAELKILHDAPGNLETVVLRAEFKGDSSLSLAEHIDDALPLQDEVDFGRVAPGESVERTLWVRNIGRSDSILTLSEVTITPSNAGFALVDAPGLPISLGAWVNGACADSAAGCPEGAAACDDVGRCVDDDGVPLLATPLVVRYTAGESAAEATFTLEHDEAGVGDTQTHVLLRGAPTEPVATWAPEAIEFPQGLVGAPPASQSFQIANTGAGPLRITRVEEPSQAAFSFSYNRAVPRVVGDAPLVLGSSADLLEVRVHFTPPAPQSFASFWRATTNDPEAMEITIPVSGTGVSCPAHASVGTSGVCECDAGYRDCSGACVMESPDSCGPGCAPCDLRPGTERSCVDGSCAYTCSAQRYDLNGDRDTPQGSSTNGCEYLCPKATPSAEQCNSIDDNCDGEADNGLAADAKEPNNSCNGRSTLPDLNQGGTSQFTAYSIYPIGDDDWYQIKVIEADDDICLCACESYTTTFELVGQPANQDYVLEVRRVSAGCGSTALSTTQSGRKAVENWEGCPTTLGCFGGGCGFTDSREYIVRVRPRNGNQTVQSCEAYTLQVSHR